ADWQGHLGHSESLLVNASTWALMLTGRVIKLDDEVRDIGSFVHRLVAKSGEPLIRQAMLHSMRIIGNQFVLGRTIEEALEGALEMESRGYRYSYDMLGEAAHTKGDAGRYFEAYAKAIAALGEKSAGLGPVGGPGISVKLSALHPRFEFAQGRRLLGELVPRLKDLAVLAAEADIGLCVDSEESDRLEIMLDVFEAVYSDRALGNWEGLGMAVQAYQKRAWAVIGWLGELAWGFGRRIPLRLVKGAYWDSEIKRAQVLGLDGYPVFTRKASTDVSYLACARKILKHGDVFYPQFATHNSHTLAAVVEMAGEMSGQNREMEFQRLHGMGELLYEQIAEGEGQIYPCRIYAPVGSHENLLAYLVRRLLENGSNTSFVNRMVDNKLPIDDIIADPVARIVGLEAIPHPRIPKPKHLFYPERLNSRGLDLAEPAHLRALKSDMEAVNASWRAAPLIDGKESSGGGEKPLFDPTDRRREVGRVSEATPKDMERALASAAGAAPGWDRTPASERARCLEMAAGLIEENRAELMACLVREAGKTIPDALAEVREAADFCRYYAHRGRADFEASQAMPGPAGEDNHLSLHGRGVFLTISPWNFPLAIFTGQAAAGLAAGNAVIAKPAEQTPLIAMLAVRLLHQGGVPKEVLNLLPGDGPGVGATLVADPRISGVAFTGSTGTAGLINRSLASRPGPIIPLIAESGGQNAMIADSSALPEQVIEDVVSSAFMSAGQRCSSLRVLFVQDDVSDRIMEMLAGATEELSVGDPAMLSTDIGPVIDADALNMLKSHSQRMEREGELLCRAPLGDDCGHGYFFAPRAFRIARLSLLEGEVFGPILHVITYGADRLDDVIEEVNKTGYGLTLGIHSRIDATVRYISERLPVGNAYVNRNQIGAV
ncbi:MAG: bifunctional proline dehydrogenase/L-glutamate gamma-semialdehyde dehydrogenase PutA, partial [Rhodospirillales bacterium]